MGVLLPNDIGPVLRSPATLIVREQNSTKATRGAPGEMGESLNLRASARRLDASPLGLSISSLGFVSDYL